MLNINSTNLMQQFQVAGKEANNFDFTTTENKLVYAIYDLKSLYTVTYTPTGDAGQKCVVKNMPFGSIMLDVEMDMIDKTSSVVIWSEKDLKTQNYTINGQIIDIDDCSKLESEIKLMPSKPLFQKPEIHKVIGHSDDETFEIFSYDADVLQCEAALCRETFDSTGNRIEGGLTGFYVRDSYPKISIQAENPELSYTNYVLGEFLQWQNATEIAARSITHYGSTIVGRLLTSSDGDPVKAAKSSAQISVGNKSFWLCTKEDDYKTAQIECVQTDHSMSKLVNSTIPFHYNAAGRFQGDFSMKVLPNENLLLLVSACVDKMCLSQTNYIQEVESMTGKFTAPIEFGARSSSSYYYSKLADVSHDIYCSPFKNTSAIYTRCLDMQPVTTTTIEPTTTTTAEATTTETEPTTTTTTEATTTEAEPTAAHESTTSQTSSSFFAAAQEIRLVKRDTNNIDLYHEQLLSDILDDANETTTDAKPRITKAATTPDQPMTTTEAIATTIITSTQAHEPENVTATEAPGNTTYHHSAIGAEVSLALLTLGALAGYLFSDV